jgi:2-(3-amino-3-carboxypropyl)histidine synthase
MYTIDTDRLVQAIKESEAQRVLIQLPDGLKPRALELQELVQTSCPGVEVLFWAGTCYGACDLPVGMERLGIDLVLHVGHTAWVW